MKDQLVVGFALFSMFFGAGNIIFPPYLGMGAGESWFTGFREFDSKKQKKRLEALQTLHFFVKFSIFILRLFTSNAII